MNTMLEEYFEELNWLGGRNVESLIDSHRSMRRTIKVFLEERNKTKEELMDEYAPYFEMRLKERYIKEEDLLKMTLAEFAERFGR